jgi:uncharacterized protein (TIGR00297 family)
VRVSASEWKRKAVHAGFGLCALTLKWLNWEQAAAVALAALLFNLWGMPRLGRGIYRDGAKPRDTGIIAYPLMVLVLLVLFRNNIYIVVAVWAMMAFGDSAAAVVGRLVEGPSLPWNAQKTWVGLLAAWAFGGFAAVLAFAFVAGGLEPAAAAVLLVGGALYAFLESVRAGVDDNLVAPIPTALALYAMAQSWGSGGWESLPVTRGLAVIGLFVNVGVALLTWRLGVVSASGALAGAFAGWLVVVFGGWGAYAVLWTFFLIGTISTRWGYRRKDRRGMAQSDHGRRGAAHVLANVGVPAALLLLGVRPIAFVASLAAALADTLGTEIGGLYGSRPISPLGFGQVSPGTPGAVSIPGLLAGLGGAAAIGWVAALVRFLPAHSIPVVAVSGLVGSLAESAILTLGRERGLRLDHDFANAFNTLAGALTALEITLSIEAHRLFLPVVGP